MALAKRKTDWSATDINTPIPLSKDMQAAVIAPSPARALQQLLDERTSTVSETERWSRRRQIVFIATSACALWAAILELATQAVRAIA